MVTAKEIMTPDTPTLSFDTSVLDAIYFLSTHKDNFVAIRADDERYHGVLTETSMTRIFLRYQSHPENEALIYYRNLFEPMQLIQENEIFPEIVKKVVTAVGHRVFVINNKSQVIGHISAKSILPYFVKEFGMSSKAQLDDLKSNMYLYENFFERSPFMMHSVDTKGEIRMANEILHQVLGYSYGELIGKTIFDIYPPENHGKAAEGIKKIISQGFNAVSKAQILTKSGQSIDVELTSRALHDQTGQAVGTITISRPLNMDFLLKVLAS